MARTCCGGGRWNKNKKKREKCNAYYCRITCVYICVCVCISNIMLRPWPFKTSGVDRISLVYAYVYKFIRLILVFILVRPSSCIVRIQFFLVVSTAIPPSRSRRPSYDHVRCRRRFYYDRFHFLFRRRVYNIFTYIQV